MLTGLQIQIDREEYSRFEPKRSTVKVRVLPEPSTGLVGEVVNVLIESRGFDIATQDITLDGDYPKGKVVEFDLNNCKDADGITLINRGIYTVTASQDPLLGGTATATGDFKVSMITADEMRTTYCQGLHLVAKTKLAAKRQPSVVSGVQITNVSKQHRTGVKALVWDATARTLTWDGGMAIPISNNTRSEILIAQNGNYIEVDLDPYELPDADAGEGILIDTTAMDDTFLQSEIEKATQEIEFMMKVFLEPTRIATEPYYSNPEEGEHFDAKAEPLAYYSKDFNTRGVSWLLNLPHNQVINSKKIEGFIGNTRALEISSGAITVNRKSGQLNILPYYGQYVAFYTFFLTFNFWGVRDFIPDFWRYKATVGLEVHSAGEVMKLIAYTAAISILTTAEQAYRAGTTSESISKDGVSRSTSYNAKGIYDSTIQNYKDWVKVNQPNISRQYRGIPMVVL